MHADGKNTRSLKAWYDRINEKFFFKELPANVIVRWAEPGEENDIASCNGPKNERHKFVILLNKDKIKTQSQKLSALLHECIHVATNNMDCHADAFAEWHLKLTERGAFRKSALIKDQTLF